MSRVIFDASALVKLVVDEAGTPEARSHFDASGHPAAPDWSMLECAQALWRKADRGEYPPEVMRHALAILQRIDMSLLASADVVDSAMQLALAQQHPVYDCAYVALALVEGAALVTADARQRQVAEAAGVDVLWIDSSR
jgi:predicted nucleic acid-binding protein